MNIMCSICRDVFTGAGNEAIYSTKCGHVFHYPCLLQWIERTSNCPQCRSKIANRDLIKLNLHIEGTAAPRTGLEDCQQRNMQFKLTMSNLELHQLREASKVASEQNKGLKLEVKRLEEEVKVVKSRECNLLQENRNLTVELATERQKNQGFRNADSETAPSLDVINLDLDDSDPELMLDIDANLRNMRGDMINQSEIINLDDSEREDNDELNRNPENVQELKNQLELKEVLLASAFARINELEKENLTWKRNGVVGVEYGRFS